ncbi:MAG: CatB-related O-acetyltransferase [Clostridioides sp.]|jgi:acetyltransferase-like isoleucine patch superfamily enzyme|nr:CatB-related O-acetyltransferase [Clostridioides sp.]
MSVYVHIKSKIAKTSIIDLNVFVDRKSVIGGYCYIAKGTIITKSIIGNYCSIGPNVKIGLGEHDYNQISTSMRFIGSPYEKLTMKECFVGNDVWIGTNAVILRGVSIGDGAVIGANAVVTKNVPPFAIVVGCPAYVKKYRFDNHKIEQITKSQWWNHSIYEAKKIIKVLEND